MKTRSYEEIEAAMLRHDAGDEPFSLVDRVAIRTVAGFNYGIAQELLSAGSITNHDILEATMAAIGTVVRAYVLNESETDRDVVMGDVEVLVGHIREAAELAYDNSGDAIQFDTISASEAGRG